MDSVGGAYAILKGYRSGDPEKAESFLNSMSPSERKLRNRNEGRLRSKRKEKLNKPGQVRMERGT